MLFQKNIIKKYIATLNDDVVMAWNQYKSYFLVPDIQANIKQSKEEQFQEGFLRELFVKVLGYTLNPSPDFNLITEQKNETNSQKADGAILLDGNVIGVIELKDHKTTDISKIDKQAFGYKSQHRYARYVIISNFEKLRLYIDNAVDCREWNLFAMTEEEFREMYLCIAWNQIKNGIALKIKSESVSSEDQITNALYKDYSQFKRILFADILQNNPVAEDKIESTWQLLLFKKTQKLLDRLLFIFFAEDRGLLPPNSMVEIIKQWRQLKELDEYKPLYDRIKKYFGYLDTGHQGKNYDIFAYNGGLFKPDEVLDNLIITDEILEKHTMKLASYDFESDVDVNILGHIFENSLSEIEEVTNSILGVEKTNTTSKRKQDGVFYTPQYITKYIVENTVGKLCAEKKAELGIVEEDYFSDQKRQKQTKIKLIEQLSQYREWLLQITICDPACGSGAFLNAALQFLIVEHKLIDEMEAKVAGESLVFPNVENSILENNLFGVDINEESVEIAQLALWLRTAKPHRKLNTLSKNIKCGNSLISDPAVAGDKAFDWEKEFPKVFEKGGFDVVIGNPPYVQLQSIGKMRDVYAKCGYESYNKSADLYCLFYERGCQLLQKKGLLGFIASNKWLKVNYGIPLRKYLTTMVNPYILVDFPGVPVFEDATVDPQILLLSKEPYRGKTFACTCKQTSDIALFIEENKKETKFDDSAWTIPDDSLAIFKKMSAGKALKDLPIIINYGIKTGFNDAFFIDGETRKRLIAEDSKSAGLIKPLLRGRDIQAWVPDLVDLYLINTHNGVKDIGIKPINIDDYPAIKNHLDQYFEKLAKRIDKGITPYNLRNCDYIREFSKPKIMYPNMTKYLPFIYDETGYFGNDKTFIITSHDDSFSLKYLVAILNSKLAKLWIRHHCPELGEDRREIRKVYFENFPIPTISEKNENCLVEYADKMLSLNSDLQQKCRRFLRRLQDNFESVKITGALESFDTMEFAEFLKELKKQKITLSLSQQDEWEDYFNHYKTECNKLSAEIAETDNEIDLRVYKLYGLTEEEIAVVENSI